MNRTDPSGYCPAPIGTNGNVICVDLFIQLETFGGFGFATGDGRGFESNSDPGKSRAYLYIYLDDNGSVVGSDLHVNTSCTLIGCYGPYLQYENLSATQNSQTGEINVTWDLKNGFSGNLLNQADTIYEAETQMGSMANGSTFLNIAANALADINGELTLARDDCGDYYLRDLNRDPFPSLEIYQYKNGEYLRTIGKLL